MQLLRSRPPSAKWPLVTPTGKVLGAVRTPVEFEAEATAKISKLERALSALYCNSPAGKGLQSLINRTRTQTGFGHPGHRYNDCPQFLVRAAKRLKKAKETGLARLEELRREAAATRPPMDVDSGSARVLQLVRQERDDLRAGGAVSKRGSVVTTMAEGPRANVSIEELLQWLTQIAAGGLHWARAKGKCGSGVAP